MTERRVLVTGIRGFVGRVAAKEFSAAGWRVFGLDRGSRANAAAVLGADGVHETDILDRARLGALVREIAPTHVLHLAAAANVLRAQESPERTEEINVRGTAHVAESVAENAPTARLVFISSGAVYRPPADATPIDETAPTEPATHYGRTKLKAEAALSAIARAGGLWYAICRPFNHTGPGQSHEYVLADFARQVAAIDLGLAPPIVTTGNLSLDRDFSDVRDVVRAYRLVLENGSSGSIFNVASGEGRRLETILESLLAFTKRRVARMTDPARVRDGEAKAIVGGIQKIAREIGWRPEIPFADTLREVYADRRLALSRRPFIESVW